MTTQEWKAFAKLMGAKIVRVEAGCVCLSWTNPKEVIEDDAWFGENMVKKITKAIERTYKNGKAK